jgi:hypothetical protein
MACGPIEKLNERKRFDPKNGAWGNISKFFLIYRKIDFLRLLLGATTLSRMTLCMMTISEATMRITIQGVATLSIRTFSLTSHSIMPQHSAE